MPNLSEMISFFDLRAGGPGSGPHTEVTVKSRPKCDFCGKEAHYDGKTGMGPWANMCENHFQQHGTGLGLGRGQRLKVEAAGTSDGAKKGWDSRGRGLAKKNFEPASSVVKKDEAVDRFPHVKLINKGQQARYTRSEPKENENIFDYHQRRIAEADAKMPEAIRNVMSPPRK